MATTRIGYMTEAGFVEKEVEFEEVTLQDGLDFGDMEAAWQSNYTNVSANSLYVEEEVQPEQEMEVHRIDIASIHSWPEFKTDWKMTCIRVFGKRICTKTPQLFTRTCHRKVYAELRYPASYEDRVKKDIIDCAKVAAAAAVAAAMATGTVGAAPAFEGVFKGCVAAKIGDAIRKVKINVGSDSSCGSWKPR